MGAAGNAMSIGEIVAGLTLRPRATLERLRLQGTIASGWAWALLVGWSALEVYVWMLAGDRHGGNTLKVLFIGEFVSVHEHIRLPRAAEFPVLLVFKVLCDLTLIAVSHRVAVRWLRPERRSIADWFKLYCVSMGVLDVYFVFSTALALLPADPGTAMMASHAALAMCLAWNIYVFVRGYAEAYGLSDDRAFRGFFLSIILIPSSLLVLLAAAGLVAALDRAVWN